jgi:hypothetical protein
MILDLDATTRNEIARMCYARWTVAYDNMKHIKSMTWETNKHVCPKAEWSLFHAEMLKSAQKELTLAEKLKADVCPFSPLIKGE